jgi:hypothetical protein
VGYIILMYGPTQMDVAAEPQQLLAHFSLHFSLIYLTHMHNLIRNNIQISYILMVQMKDSIYVKKLMFCEIVTA